MFNRRDLFVIAGAMAACSGTRRAPPKLPAVISTWEFGQAANAEAWKILADGGNSLDAVEQGVNHAELDPSIMSVGWGGLPNEDGEVTLDAMIMYGPTHVAGAVGCLKSIRTPISVARKVMEKTKHTFLVGDDAKTFALKLGFKEEELLTDAAKKVWEKWKADPKRSTFWTHDTIGMVAIDKEGRVTAGCSTSGLGWKIRGRVGDSPIVGAGAYCDQDVGGAAATGNGDWMMRFCLSYSAVEFMRAGKSPDDACRAALKRMTDKNIDVGACLVALNASGEFGAAKIGARPFPHAVRNADADEVRTIK